MHFALSYPVFTKPRAKLPNLAGVCYIEAKDLTR